MLSFPCIFSDQWHTGNSIQQQEKTFVLEVPLYENQRSGYENMFLCRVYKHVKAFPLLVRFLT